jgi:hypothetical protein
MRAGSGRTDNAGDGEYIDQRAAFQPHQLGAVATNRKHPRIPTKMAKNVRIMPAMRK